MIPPNPAITEHSMKQNSLTRHTGTPIAPAASGWPPVALIQFPTLDLANSVEAANAIARNQMNDARNNPPGPTNWVNSPVARSSGSKGGNPPETTTVSERTMNSMPSVAMKLGMAKVKVMNPFTNPIAAASRRPRQNRRESRHAGDDQERRRHRRQRERRANRKVEFAADHQNRDADRDEADLGQQSENAAQIVGGQKSPG